MNGFLRFAGLIFVTALLGLALGAGVLWAVSLLPETVQGIAVTLLALACLSMLASISWYPWVKDL